MQKEQGIETQTRTTAAGSLPVAVAVHATTGGILALANWLWAFPTASHARSLLITMLGLGCAVGVLAGVFLWAAWRLLSRTTATVAPSPFFFYLASALLGPIAAWGALRLALAILRSGASRALLVVLVLGACLLLSSLAGRVMEAAASAIGHARQLRRMARIGGFGIAVVMSFGLAGYVLTGRWVVSRDLTEVPAPSTSRPHVILISLDTVRPDHISALGYTRPTTPYLDEILSQGAVFTNSVASSSWTVLSHATLLTGASPSRIGPSLLESAASGALTVPREALTLAEVLHDHGYRTAAFIGGATVSSSFDFDQGFEYFDDLMAPSFQSVTDSLLFGFETRSLLGIPRNRFLGFLDPVLVGVNNLNQGQRHSPLSDSFLEHAHFPRRYSNSAVEVNHKVRSYLEGADTSRPQFLFVHYFDAHDPFDAPEPFGGRWADHGDGLGYILDNGLVERVFRGEIPLTDAEREKLIALYDENLAALDAGVDSLMSMLKEEGLLDDAIVAFFSDHGESFGEHGRLFHGHSLSEELIRNIFAVRYPSRIEPGLILGEQIGAVDIMPTLLDLASVPAPASILRGEGRSLAPLLIGSREEEEDERPAFSELYAGAIREAQFGPFELDYLSVRHEGWKLVTDSSGSRHLYHVASDPGEMTDLSDAEPDRADRLQEMLERWRAKGYKKSDTEGEIDQRRLEELKGLGYVDR